MYHLLYKNISSPLQKYIIAFIKTYPLTKIYHRLYKNISSLHVGLEPTTFWLTAKRSTTELTKLS